MKIKFFRDVTFVVGQIVSDIAGSDGASPTPEMFYPKTHNNVQEEIFSSTWKSLSSLITVTLVAGNYKFYLNRYSKYYSTVPWNSLLTAKMYNESVIFGVVNSSFRLPLLTN